jgi:DNA mismatch repair ATPase MutS
MDGYKNENGYKNGNGDGAEQTDKHLCIFDELYSGTNPEEAVESATSFLKYLSKKPNVSYILTTHYVELCRNLEKNKKIVNMHMGIANANANAGQKKTNDFSYTFLLKKGISTVKGGRKVLRDLNYPAEMLS